MFDFKIKDSKPQDVAVRFEELGIGETFMYYSAYEENGLDTFANLVLLKSGGATAVCLNSSSRGSVHTVSPDVPMVAVRLVVTDITLTEGE